MNHKVEPTELFIEHRIERQGFNPEEELMKALGIERSDIISGDIYYDYRRHGWVIANLVVRNYKPQLQESKDASR